jgi:tetratricopeptide (TPR) repeat protein
MPIGQGSESWLDRLEKHHDALHDLVQGLLTARPTEALEAVSVLWRFWWLRGHMAEGRGFLERTRSIEGSAHIEILKALGTIAFRQGDLDAAEQAFRERLDLAEQASQRGEVADALADMARIALRRGDFASVRDYAERGYAAAAGLGPEAVRIPLHMRAAVARMEGRLDDARALYVESRELNARLGNEANVAGEDHNLVHVALHSGDRVEAGRRFRASSEWIFSHGNAYLRPYAFLDAGVLALHDGDFERAARLVAVAQRIFEETGSVPDPDDRVELDNAVSELKAKLAERFDAMWTDGRALDIGDAEVLASGI